jgi:hypothetical protein
VSSRRVAVGLSLVLVFYLVLVGSRGVTLVRDGRPIAVLLGVGVLLLPLVGAWVVVKELQFGRATERLGRELAAQGGLAQERPPTRPSGRVDRAAADEVFDRRRAEVEADPGDWRAWYRLATAYGDAGDAIRGRRAMRRAITLHQLR